jgi:hypothetical protein
MPHVKTTDDTTAVYALALLRVGSIELSVKDEEREIKYNQDSLTRKLRVQLFSAGLRRQLKVNSNAASQDIC